MLSRSLLGLAVAAVLISPGDVASSAASTRDHFMARCMSQMMWRAQKAPGLVCSCLHDTAVQALDDADMQAAVLHNIEDNGIPGIDVNLVPPDKRDRINAALTRLARPALACIYDPVP